MLQTEDLKAMDTLLRQYCGKGSSQSCHDRILMRERQKSSVSLWQMLSEGSALFGITGGVGTESVVEADDARKDGNKKSGKAGKGKKGPKGKGAGEYCVDESSRSLRLCVGAWQALYPMGAMAAIPGLISDAKDEEEAMIRAKTAAAQPKEEFVGENLLQRELGSPDQTRGGGSEFRFLQRRRTPEQDGGLPESAQTEPRDLPRDRADEGCDPALDRRHLDLRRAHAVGQDAPGHHPSAGSGQPR
jgi:hypothetical protein